MVTSNSRLAYIDCHELMDQALEAKSGIRFQVADRGTANHFRVRLHTARKINRQDNKSQYEPDHLLWGRSEYDVLLVRIKEIDSKTYIYILKQTTNQLTIEDLEGVDANVIDESPASNNGEAEGESPSEGEAKPTTPQIDRRF